MDTVRVRNKTTTANIGRNLCQPHLSTTHKRPNSDRDDSMKASQSGTEMNQTPCAIRNQPRAKYENNSIAKKSWTVDSSSEMEITCDGRRINTSWLALSHSTNSGFGSWRGVWAGLSGCPLLSYAFKWIHSCLCIGPQPKTTSTLYTSQRGPGTNYVISIRSKRGKNAALPFVFGLKKLQKLIVVLRA